MYIEVMVIIGKDTYAWIKGIPCTSLSALATSRWTFSSLAASSLSSLFNIDSTNYTEDMPIYYSQAKPIFKANLHLLIKEVATIKKEELEEKITSSKKVVEKIEETITTEKEKLTELKLKDK